MGMPINSDSHDLDSLIREADLAKQQFIATAKKYVELRNRKKNLKNPAIERKILEEEAQKKYEETLDESVYAAMQANIRKLEDDVKNGESMLVVAVGLLSKSGKELDRATTAAAQQASSLWRKVEAQELEAIEKGIMVAIAKKIYIGRKVNNGNYSPDMFVGFTGKNEIMQAFEQLYDKHLNHLDGFLESAVDELPKIPYAIKFNDINLASKPTSAFSSSLLDESRGTGFYPWPDFDAI